MPYLLDTNICIALLKGRDHSLIKSFQDRSPDEFRLCAIVKAELLFGARNSLRVNENLKVLEGFFRQFESLPFDDACAEHYGIIRALLQRAGTPIGANDLVIAATALYHDHVLLTRNREEFLRVPGLRVETW